KKVQDIVSKKLQYFYAIPDFETFARDNEPEQKSNLFTNKDLQTFSMNYTLNGKLYSVDVWKDDNRPYATYYIKKGTTEDVAMIIPTIVKNPGKRAKITKTRGSSER